MERPRGRAGDLKEPLNGLSNEPFTSAPAIRTQSFTARPCGTTVVAVAVLPERVSCEIATGLNLYSQSMRQFRITEAR
jgi:hypothetical protein